MNKVDAAETIGALCSTTENVSSKRQNWEIMEILSYAVKCSLIPDFMLNSSGVIAWDCTEISPAEILSNVMVVGIV